MVAELPPAYCTPAFEFRAPLPPTVCVAPPAPQYVVTQDVQSETPSLHVAPGASRHTPL